MKQGKVSCAPHWWPKSLAQMHWCEPATAARRACEPQDRLGQDRTYVGQVCSSEPWSACNHRPWGGTVSACSARPVQQSCFHSGGLSVKPTGDACLARPSYSLDIACRQHVSSKAAYLACRQHVSSTTARCKDLACSQHELVVIVKTWRLQTTVPQQSATSCSPRSPKLRLM